MAPLIRRLNDDFSGGFSSMVNDIDESVPIVLDDNGGDDDDGGG